jgi:hypothetical protein
MKDCICDFLVGLDNVFDEVHNVFVALNSI